MRKQLLSLIAVFTVVCCASCKMNVLRGTGNTTTATPAVSAFNAVDIDLPLAVDINVQSGTQPGIQFSGYENVIKHLKTKVEDSTLVIYMDLDDTWTIDRKGITVQITLPYIIGLSLEGSSGADIHGNIAGPSFDMDISGASTVNIDNINVDSFSVDVSGAGDLRVNGGAVKFAEYEIDGAGDVKAFSLQSLETSATISGAGTNEVTASQKLTANINGAGTIKYKGHPVVSKEVSGIGTIKDAN